jgi:hypothetical protein
MKKHHKEDNSSWGIIFRKRSFRWSIPKDILVRGNNLEWKYTFGIDEKGT